jgi:AcrR family transcriptional regulator
MSAVAVSDRRIAELESHLELTSLESRVLDGALLCVARWGLAKTTLDDVSRAAGCSRATVYRAFPGGKEALFDRLLRAELDRFCASIAAQLASAATLEDLLVTGITSAGSGVLDHAALQFLLQHEPAAVLPAISFHRFDEVLATARTFATPHLERWLDTSEAQRVAEWVTRVIVSYVMCPAEGVDLRDETSVRQLVRQFILPGLAPITQEHQLA